MSAPYGGYPAPQQPAAGPPGQPWGPPGPPPAERKAAARNQRTWSPGGLPLGVLATISLALGLFVFPPDYSGESAAEQVGDEPGIMVLLIAIPLVVAGQVLTATLPMRQGVRRWVGSGPLGILSSKGTVTTKIGALLITITLLIILISLTNPTYLLPSYRWHSGLYFQNIGGLLAEFSVLIPHMKLRPRPAQPAFAGQQPGFPPQQGNAQQGNAQPGWPQQGVPGQQPPNFPPQQGFQPGAPQQGAPQQGNPQQGVPHPPGGYPPYQ